MGLDLTYQADGQEFGIRFSHADWDCIGQLKVHLPDAIADCFEVANLGEPVVVARNSLCRAIEEIDALLKDRPDLLPFTYQYKPEYLQCGTNRLNIEFDFDTGGSGIQMPGDEEGRYMIWAGLNELLLKKFLSPPDGLGTVVEVRDLRGESELMTLNCGLIRFRKLRAKSSLRRGLKGMREFLSGIRADEVTKVVG